MHWVRWLFWNTTEKRLRAGWRIAIHFVLWIYTPALLKFAIGDLVASGLPVTFQTSERIRDLLVEFMLRLPAILLSTWLVVRWIDHRSFADLGFRQDKRWWLDFSFGLILGAILMGLIFWVEWFNGWVKITNTFQQTQITLPFPLTILATLLVFVVVGLTEELLARGYQLRNLAEGFNFPWLGTQGAVLAAWLVSSVFFGLLHVRNPHSSWGSTVVLMVVGLFFGLGYLLTGNLAIPIGLHITWNFFQGSVLGFPVSGRDFGNVTIIALQQGGPDLWTGAAFGPEAGLLGLVATIIGCGAILLWVRWQYGKVSLCTSLAHYMR